MINFDKYILQYIGIVLVGENWRGSCPGSELQLKCYPPTTTLTTTAKGSENMEFWRNKSKYPFQAGVLISIRIMMMIKMIKMMRM